MRITRSALAVALALSACVAPFTSEAQTAGKTWQVGFLSGNARPPDGAPPLALRQALQELG